MLTDAAFLRRRWSRRARLLEAQGHETVAGAYCCPLAAGRNDCPEHGPPWEDDPSAYYADLSRGHGLPRVRWGLRLDQVPPVGGAVHRD